MMAAADPAAPASLEDERLAAIAELLRRADAHPGAEARAREETRRAR